MTTSDARRSRAAAGVGAYADGRLSHWMDALDRDAPEKSAGESAGESAAGSAGDSLEGAYDLVVVGGGLTGLWTAYLAAVAAPSARIVVLEAERVGFGASGRNGGWLSPLLPGNRGVYARTHGLDGVRAFQRLMIESIDDVLGVLEAERIDAHQVRGGQLQVATTPAGLGRLREARAGHLRFGYADDEAVLLDAAETRSRIAVDGALGGLLVPATARVDPARLVRGLASAVRRRGVTVAEQSPVTRAEPGRVHVHGRVLEAARVAVCVESGTPAVLGAAYRRSVVPVHSAMIVTPPLPGRVWDAIGWGHRECLGDAAHGFVYAQRTADDRIAIGGRGSPYAYASRGAGRGEVDPATVGVLEGRLRTLFPGHDLRASHAWRGSIGVTRDWCATVRGVHHPATGARLAVAYGYAGHGVTATHLAARTLLDRLSGAETPLTALPWNDHAARRWEPEPLRWLGIHGMYRLLTLADRWEESRRSSRTSALARLGSRLAGLHE